MLRNTKHVVVLDLESEDIFDVDEVCSIVNRLFKDILRSDSGTFKSGSLMAFGPDGQLAASIEPLSKAIGS